MRSAAWQRNGSFGEMHFSKGKDLPGAYEVVHPHEVINQIESDPKQRIKRVGELIELHRLDAVRRSAHAFISGDLREKVKCVGEMLRHIGDIPTLGQQRPQRWYCHPV